MKKFFKTILYILSAAALLTVAACGGSTNKTSDDVDIYDGVNENMRHLKTAFEFVDYGEDSEYVCSLSVSYGGEREAAAVTFSGETENGMSFSEFTDDKGQTFSYSAVISDLFSVRGRVKSDTGLDGSLISSLVYALPEEVVSSDPSHIKELDRKRTQANTYNYYITYEERSIAAGLKMFAAAFGGELLIGGENVVVSDVTGEGLIVVKSLTEFTISAKIECISNDMPVTIAYRSYYRKHVKVIG